jgi:phage major head subunit gpT-like protein
MAVLRNQFTEAMKKDAYKYFWESYPTKPPVYEDLFEVIPSDAAYEQFTSAIGLGELLEKPENEDIQSDQPMESYTIVCKNRSFARKVSFSYESMQDAKKGGNLLMSVVSSWGRMYPITKEKFYAKFFNNGALTAGHDVFNNTITDVVSDASGALIYDSQPFFDAAHADKVGNTYDNHMASSALTKANLEIAYNTFVATNNRDERGEVIDLQPDTLLIPPALHFTARVILETTLIPGSTDNDIYVLEGIVNAKQWSYLTADGSDSPWFLGNVKQGLLATEREGISIDFYQDEENLSYIARIFGRFGGCVTNWRYWINANGATS